MRDITIKGCWKPGPAIIIVTVYKLRLPRK